MLAKSLCQFGNNTNGFDKSVADVFQRKSWQISVVKV